MPDSSPTLIRDGDPDRAARPGPTEHGRLVAQRRGQVVLDLLDQVPAAAEQHGMSPRSLRLTVTHGGRAGDSDLELARLGLLWEEEPGDPLTSAEGNALVEELTLYRDANGNGTFDPGIDTLVATVPKLVLAGGIQTIPFADGDPNIQVAFGTPRDVLPDRAAHRGREPAGAQPVPRHAPRGRARRPRRRRTAAATSRSRSACPADFATVMIGPVLPVDLMRFTVE